MYMVYCAFVVLFVSHTVSGLTCYTCDSKNSISCAWGLTSFTFPTQECQSAGFLDNLVGPKCYKITAQSKDGREYIDRGCLPPGTIGCSAVASALGWISSQSSNDGESLRSLDCDTCNTDRCNSATKVTGVIFTGVILVVATFII